MPSIADTIDLVKAQLPTIPMELGEEYQQTLTAPPYVVFVPRGDRFSRPSGRVSQQSLHTSVQTRMVGLEARIWAAAVPTATDSYADLRATELLVDKVIIALHAVCQGSIEFEDSEWSPTGPAQQGRQYLLRFRVQVPVTPTDDDSILDFGTFADVSSPADTPEAGVPAATTVTVELASDVTGTPSP